MGTIRAIKLYLEERKEVKDTIPFKLLSLLGTNVALIINDVSDSNRYGYIPMMIIGNYKDKEE